SFARARSSSRSSLASSVLAFLPSPQASRRSAHKESQCETPSSATRSLPSRWAPTWHDSSLQPGTPKRAREPLHPPLLPRPERLAELALHHLAVRIPRPLRDALPPARRLVVCQPLAAPGLGRVPAALPTATQLAG